MEGFFPILRVSASWKTALLNNRFSELVQRRCRYKTVLKKLSAAYSGKSLVTGNRLSTSFLGYRTEARLGSWRQTPPGPKEDHFWVSILKYISCSSVHYIIYTLYNLKMRWEAKHNTQLINTEEQSLYHSNGTILKGCQQCSSRPRRGWIPCVSG